MLDQLGTPEAQRQLGRLTQNMTRAVLLGTAQGLERDLGPALRTTIERDVAQGMTSALNGPLHTALGNTARAVMTEGVSAAMGTVRGDLAGMSSPAVASDVRSTLDTGRKTLIALAVLVGLCAFALLCGALVAVARTRRTRAEAERLEATLRLVLGALRETQGQPASGEVLDILRSNLQKDGHSQRRTNGFRAQA